MLCILIAVVVMVQCDQKGITSTYDTKTSDLKIDLESIAICHCDLLLSQCDIYCCCDSDCTDQSTQWITDGVCLPESTKEVCIKKYLVSSTNLKDGSGITIRNTDSQLCMKSDYTSTSTSYIDASTIQLPQELLNSYYMNVSQMLYPKLRNTNDTAKLNVTQLRTILPDKLIIYYPDSNGFCQQIKTIINRVPISKQYCVITMTQANTYYNIFKIQSSSNIGTPSMICYNKDTNSISSDCNTGSLNGIRYEFTYGNSNSMTLKQIFYISSAQTILLRKLISIEVTFNSNDMSFYDGQIGHQSGITVQGFIRASGYNRTNTLTPLGLILFKGYDRNTNKLCTTFIDKDINLFDTFSYESLQFNKNTQYSCQIQYNDVCTIDAFTGLSIFNSFPTQLNNSISIATTPYFELDGNTIRSDDWINSIILNDHQFKVSLSGTNCQLTTTQYVMIYYNEMGMKGQRQRYIQNVTIGYKDTQTVTTNGTITFRINVKFIDLARQEIDNTLPEDPPFIPQLPSDIFFPIWYETYAAILLPILCSQLMM